MIERLEQEASMREIGWIALMVFRGAREDGSLIEALWATAAAIIAFIRSNDASEENLS